MEIVDVGLMEYNAAWRRQLELHAEVVREARPEGVLMFVEHPAVVTIGRRIGSERHLLVDAETLKARGVSLVETDRGGDITFHGPGQLVVYPIIPLNRYNLGLHGYMRMLEGAIIAALASFGVIGRREADAAGVWVDVPCDGREAIGSGGAADMADAPGLIPRSAKICALGIKVKRWVTLHGAALNVTTDLSFFGLINPCGLGRPVTSLKALLNDGAPGMPAARDAVARHLTAALAQRRGSGSTF